MKYYKVKYFFQENANGAEHLKIKSSLIKARLIKTSFLN